MSWYVRPGGSLPKWEGMLVLADALENDKGTYKWTEILILIPPRAHYQSADFSNESKAQSEMCTRIQQHWVTSSLEWLTHLIIQCQIEQFNENR